MSEPETLDIEITESAQACMEINNIIKGGEQDKRKLQALDIVFSFRLEMAEIDVMHKEGDVPGTAISSLKVEASKKYFQARLSQRTVLRSYISGMAKLVRTALQDFNLEKSATQLSDWQSLLIPEEETLSEAN